MNLPWLPPPPQEGVKHPDLRAPQPSARLHLARRPSGNLRVSLCWAPASPLSPPSPQSSGCSPQLSLHLQLLLGPGPLGGGAWIERGPLPRAERSAAQTHHAVLLVPRGVGQGAGGGGRPAVLFVRAGPIGCKEKGPRWAVRGGQTAGVGHRHLCTWARRGRPGQPQH